MSLSLGTGPLTRAPGGAFNFDLDAAAPAHRIYFAEFLPRVRAYVDGDLALDTTRGRLLYETGIPARFYAPVEDYTETLLTPTDHTTHCPFKGDASYWTVGEHSNALWAYPEPLPAAEWLAGYAALYPERAEWLVEEERVNGHLRDPFHRVDAHPSSRRVRVRAGDQIVVDTDRAVLLFETGLPPRAYIARRDIQAAIEPHERRTSCPYKGDARYWTVAGVEAAAWSYEAPRPEVAVIAGLVAFDPEQVAVEIEG